MLRHLYNSLICILPFYISSGERLRQRILNSSKSLREYFNEYRMRWYFQTKVELLFMTIWHAVINVFHCIPLIVSGCKIIKHSTRLEENGFAQTKSELNDLNTIKILMIVAPIFVGFVVPLIQWGTLMLYYHYGHPWCRIFIKADFKKPVTQTSTEHRADLTV